MKLSQFKFKLPEEQIALEPSYHRDECKLMVLHRKSQKIETGLDFRNILDYFDEDDAFIFNDTKVFPARLYGTKEKTDAKIEVFLLRELNADQRLWDVLVEPARKIRIGNKLFFEEDGPMVAEVIDNTTSRGRTLRFLYDCPHDEFKQLLFGLGEAPLPRYIIDRRPANEDDMERFQTIYAKNEGAVTAPATGLHFSRELMKRMEIKGINFAFITLHCGLGNFESTARATESAVGTDGMLKEYEGWTNKFIFPPYEFGLCNALIGNFYHPESPMMMTEASFVGYDLLYEGYQRALKEGYMFGCYGDALLMLDD